MKYIKVSMLCAASFFGASASLAAPPPGIQGNVTVVNEESDPVPVVVQNSGQGDPIEVFSADPEFLRIQRTIFGDDPEDNTKTVAVSQRAILYDVLAQTNIIHQVAGCVIQVYKFDGGTGGPITSIFEARHADKDAILYSDGQVTQQRLGRGIVIEAGDDLVISGNLFTNPDVPVRGPDAVCSSNVQLFGEVLPE